MVSAAAILGDGRRYSWLVWISVGGGDFSRSFSAVVCFWALLLLGPLSGFLLVLALFWLCIVVSRIFGLLVILGLF